MTDRRKSMTPYHRELLLFLRMNKDLWSAVDIQTIIDVGVVAGDNGEGAELV